MPRATQKGLKRLLRRFAWAFAGLAALSISPWGYSTRNSSMIAKSSWYLRSASGVLTFEESDTTGRARTRAAQSASKNGKRISASDLLTSNMASRGDWGWRLGHLSLGSLNFIAIPYWMLVGGFLLGAAICFRLSRPRRRRGRCPACGYDLRGSKLDRCPECGRRVPFSTLPSFAPGIHPIPTPFPHRR